MGVAPYGEAGLLPRSAMGEPGDERELLRSNKLYLQTICGRVSKAKALRIPHLAYQTLKLEVLCAKNVPFLSMRVTICGADLEFDQKIDEFILATNIQTKHEKI